MMGKGGTKTIGRWNCGLTMVIRSEAAADYNDLTGKWFGHGEGERAR